MLTTLDLKATLEPYHRDRGITAVATISHKAKNQDFAEAIRNRYSPVTGAAIADGVGSFYGSADASALVARTIRAYLEADVPVWTIDLRNAFSVAAKLLRQHGDEQAKTLPPGVSLHNAFGTTALCAVDAGDTFKMAYVGNGSMLHLRGDFDQYGPGRLLPSGTVNLLNPHCQWQDGRSMLARVLSPVSSEADATPTLLQLSKDAELGDILVLTTDGVYSSDEVRSGRDSQGEIFIEAKRSIVLLYALLSRFLQGEPTEAGLKRCLDAYLLQLDAEHLVDDDCTIAVLISAQALLHRKKLNADRLPMQVAV
jgi:PPM family protein phosphatase